MGLRAWSLETWEIEAKTKSESGFEDARERTEPISVIVTADCKPSPKSANVIEKVLTAFDGEIVGFTGAAKELYEERAAIMEFDGGLTKRQAEAEAAKIILSHLT